MTSTDPAGDVRPRSLAWWIAVGSVAVLVSAAGVWGGRALILRQRVAGCQTLGDRVRTVWTADARELLEDGILRSGAADARGLADRTTARIDDFAARWHDVRATACVDAEVELTLEHAYYAQVTWCLDDASFGLEALLAVAARPTRADAYRSIDVAAALPSPSLCRRPAAAVRLPRLPDDSERAHLRDVRMTVQRAALGDDDADEALALATAAVGEADAIGWAPLTSFAVHQVCRRQLERGAFVSARTECERAFEVAHDAAQHDMAADVAIDLVQIGIAETHLDDARRWSERAEQALTAIVDLDAARAVRWSIVRGDLELAAGDVTRARADHDRAREIAERELDVGDPLRLAVAEAIARDASTAGDLAGALAAREEALALAEAIYGPEHPQLVPRLSALAKARRDRGDTATAADDEARAQRVSERAWLVDAEAP